MTRGIEANRHGQSFEGFFCQGEQRNGSKGRCGLNPSEEKENKNHEIHLKRFKKYIFLRS